MRQLDPSYKGKYRYPSLDETQLIPLQLLKAGLDEGASMTGLVSLYQKALFSLFAHHQHKYATSRELDQFFSPVICFLVLSSNQEKGGFRPASGITQIIAHIMFCARAAIFFEVKAKARRDNISLSE